MKETAKKFMIFIYGMPYRYFSRKPARLLGNLQDGLDQWNAEHPKRKWLTIDGLAKANDGILPRPKEIKNE